MAYDIGTARGVIEMDYNGAGITKAQSDLDSLDSKGTKAGINLDKTSRAMATGGLVIAAGLAVGVNAAANFEQRMSAIQAVSGATGSEMDALSAKALQLGKDTSFSAGESAQAMEELIKAGLSVDDVLNGAADATVALAAAGEVALPEAAMIASNAMNQFNLKAKDMVGVVDSIAGAANSSAIDVSDFGQSLSQVGAVANLAGVSFDDTAAAIAIMGNAGIKGSDAGTSLKSMLSRLQPTTTAAYNEMLRLGLITFDANKAMTVLADNGIKGVTKQNAEQKLRELAASLSESEVGSAKAEKKFRDLGLQTNALSNGFYDAKGNTKSLSDISGKLSDSLEGMTKQQKQAALQILFGSDAIRSAAILSNEGAAGFDKMAASMAKTSAADVAATRLDNFKGSMEAMKGSLETLGITFGTILLPALRSIVDAVTSALNWFTNLSGTTQKIIVAFLAFVAVGLLVGAAIIKIILLVGKVQAAMVLLRGTMIATWAAGLAPILPFIAAIALIGIALALLWNKSETFRNIVMAVWNAVKAAAAAVAAWFMGTFVPALMGAWNAIQNGVKTAFTFVSNFIKGAMSLVVSIVKGYLNALQAIWNAIWGTFGPLIKAVWGLITAIIKLAWTVIKGVVLLGVNVVKDVVEGAFNAIKGVTSAVWNAIKAVIQGVWNVIGPFVKTAVNNIQDVIENVWGAIKSATSSVWNALEPIVSKAVGGIMSVVNGIKDKVLGAFDFSGDMYAKGKAIIQSLIDGITSMIGKVTDIINSITDKVAKFLPGSPVKTGPLRVLNRGHAGKEIVQMAIDGIEKMAGPLQKAFADTMPASAWVGTARGTSGAPLALTTPKPQSAAGGAAPPHFDVKVFLGDRELTDLVRVEIGETLSPLTTLTRQGAI